jgi:hypothetical protein
LTRAALFEGLAVAVFGDHGRWPVALLIYDIYQT